MVILASQSPRRREFLRYIFSEFEVRPAHCDEASRAQSASERATEIAVRKARYVAQNAPRDLVIGADTLVLAKGEILGKPRDAQDAFRMLSMLSGGVCEVFTGVGVCREGQVWGMCERTAVEFFPLSRELIESYIASNEPMDKAGAFGAQGRGALLVRRIDGDFYNVCGLPVAQLFRLLERTGALVHEPAILSGKAET